MWFFVLDAIRGRPLYTPTVLGLALFRHGVALDNPGAITPNFDMVMSFTWVHLLVFLLIGIVASRLIGLVERNPNLGFGVVIFATNLADVVPLGGIGHGGGVAGVAKGGAELARIRMLQQAHELRTPTTPSAIAFHRYLPTFRKIPK